MLHHHITGKGPLVVLLHGYLSSSHYWDNIIPELATHYRVMTIDLIGFGDSPKPKNADYSLQTHAEHVRETIASFAGGEPAVIIGHSMGALIAAKVGVLDPQLCRAVIACNMPLFDDSRVARHAFEQTNVIYRVMLYHKISMLLWPVMNISQLLINHLFRHGQMAYSPKHSRTSRYRSLVNVIEKSRGIELIMALRCPVTLIMGTYDRKEYAATLATVTLNDTIRVVWCKTGHHTPHQMPEVVIRAIDRAAG